MLWFYFGCELFTCFSRLWLFVDLDCLFMCLLVVGVWMCWCTLLIWVICLGFLILLIVVMI